MINAFSKKIKIKNDKKALLVLFNKKTDENNKFIKVQDGMGMDLWIKKSWIYKHYLRRDQYAVILDLMAEEEFNTHYEDETKKFFDARLESSANLIRIGNKILSKTIEENMIPEERKRKISKLRTEHQPYFEKVGIPEATFIPKMAYRPKGKDELYVSFFPSEMKKTEDLYTEFVSIEYECEDPKRTLYLYKHNEFWEEEYEAHKSSRGYVRYLVPVSELKVINDVNSRKKVTFDTPLENPDDNQKNLFKALGTIAKQLDRIATILDKKLN